MKPSGQKHEKLPTVFTHDPPLRHPALKPGSAHSSASETTRHEQVIKIPFLTDHHTWEVDTVATVRILFTCTRIRAIEVKFSMLRVHTKPYRERIAHVHIYRYRK